ncbi:MAG: sensor histidine kinase [Gammaproteobacteria bacterium]
MLMRWSLSLRVGTVASVVVLLVALLVLTRSVQRQDESWRWVVHTREVLEAMQSVLALAGEAEAAQRGFLVANTPAHLATFQQAALAVPPAVDALDTLTADNHVQQRAIAQLRALVSQRIAQLQKVAAIKRERNVIDPGMLEVGLAQKQAIQAQAALIRAEEERLLAERERRVRAARAQLIGAVGAMFVLSIGLLVVLRVLAEQDARRLRAKQQGLEQAQRELADANRLLEQRIDERTRQIAEANAELQAFAHTVAHDLRAPLRNVEGFASALLEDEGERMSEEGRQFAGRICAAVVRMDRLIIDLLAYSRLSRSELRLHSVAVAQVMQSVRRDLEALLRESGAQLTVDEALPTVEANEGVLAQVLANLLSNALKFVAPGVRPAVSVRGGYSGAMATITVEDNGIGIDPAHREQVFGVFERLHGQEQYPGTGIGLAIVRKGVERMGGSVTVEGREQGGSRFTVHLRAAARPS